MGAYAALAAVWLLAASAAWAQSALQNAAELARQGRYEEARKALEGAADPTLVPEQIAFHRLKAAIASGLHEAKAAAKEMEAALALDPQDARLLLATSVAESAAGDYASALHHAEAAPESLTREEVLARICEARADFQSAAKAYGTAVQMAPEEERLQLALGLDLIKAGEGREAVNVLKESARRLPDSAKIRALLGVAQFADGYPDEAARSLEEAGSLDPHSNGTRAALARIVLQSSLVPPERTLQQLCNWNRTVCAAIQLRMAHASGDDLLFARATETLRLSAQNDPVGRCELARAYEWQGELKAARPEMEACVRLDGTPQNHYRLGILYKRLGLSQLSAREMERRQELLRANSEGVSAGLNALAGTGIMAH